MSPIRSLSHSLSLSLLLAAVSTARAADFNGDGYADIAIMSHDAHSTTTSNGAVTVLYGIPGGFSHSFTQRLTPLTLPTTWVDLCGFGYGYTLATGDFNGDGYDDLVVGCPNGTVTGHVRAGFVAIYRGSSLGVVTTSPTILHQDSTDVADRSEDGDEFGFALAAGHFDTDAYEDLAISTRSEGLSGAAKVGLVQVFHGGANGIRGAGSWAIHQDAAGVEGVCAANDGFGWQMTAGDFDGNGIDDLAVTIPREPVSNPLGYTSSGAAQVFFADASRLQAANDVIVPFYQAQNFQLGYATLAAGDFDGNGKDELVMSATESPLWGAEGWGGTVRVFRCSQAMQFDLSTAGTSSYSLLSLGYINPADRYDLFGMDLAVGDFDADGREDLAIGIPDEDGKNKSTGKWCSGSGAVAVLFGSASGLDAINWKHIGQEMPDVIPGVNENFDHFGSSLAVGDFDADGDPDLLIGVEGEDYPNDITNTGNVVLVPGDRTSRLLTGSASSIYKHLDWVPGSAATGEMFGRVLGD